MEWYKITWGIDPKNRKPAILTRSLPSLTCCCWKKTIMWPTLITNPQMEKNNLDHHKKKTHLHRTFKIYHLELVSQIFTTPHLQESTNYTSNLFDFLVPSFFFGVAGRLRRPPWRLWFLLGTLTGGFTEKILGKKTHGWWKKNSTNSWLLKKIKRITTKKSLIPEKKETSLKIAFQISGWCFLLKSGNHLWNRWKIIGLCTIASG